MAQADTSTADHFTVFIRLPFPRGDFIDPPPVCHQLRGFDTTGMLTWIKQVEWTAEKQRRLWDELSQSADIGIDCEAAPFIYFDQHKLMRHRARTVCDYLR